MSVRRTVIVVLLVLIVLCSFALAKEYQFSGYFNDRVDLPSPFSGYENNEYLEDPSEDEQVEYQTPDFTHPIHSNYGEQTPSAAYNDQILGMEESNLELF